MPSAGGSSISWGENKASETGGHVAHAARAWSRALSSKHARSRHGGLPAGGGEELGPPGHSLYVVNDRPHGVRGWSSRAPAFFEASWTQASSQSCIRPRALVVTNVPGPGQFHPLQQTRLPPRTAQRAVGVGAGGRWGGRHRPPLWLWKSAPDCGRSLIAQPDAAFISVRPGKSG